MKKKFHFFITVPIFIVLSSTLLFFSLPYLFDLFIFPRLMAELPFTEKVLSLSRISPWTTRGTLTLADVDQPTLSVPKFELYYTPDSLIRGRISALLLDSASIQVAIKDGQPVIHGFSGNDSPDKQKDKPSSFVLPMAVETIILRKCRITLHRDLQKSITVIVDGRFSLSFLEQAKHTKILSALLGKIVVEGDLKLSGNIDLKTGDNGYEATVKLPRVLFNKDEFIFATNSSEQPTTLQLTVNPEKIHYALTNFVLAKPEKATIDLRGEIATAKGTFSGIGHVFFEKIKSVISLNFNGKNQQSHTSISYELASDAFTLEDAFSVSPFKATGDISLDGVNIAANLNSIVPKITIARSETTLHNLSLQLPFHYPPLAAGTAGVLKIEEIRYKNTNSGRLQAKFVQSSSEITFTTLFTTPFIPNLQLACNGSAQMTADISAHCRFPETPINSATLPGFISLPDKLSIKGKLAAIGEFHITDTIPTGKITLDFRDGILTQGENTLSDINFDIVFPHLPLLQSDPGQLCTIGALNLGKINMSDGRIHFRIEDEQAIFLEKIRLTWCGGKVETGSFTLARDMKELETTLYCDRLGFTELLAQFGINQTEGQGSLNGRLPMIISRQGVSFDDGFLFSTPGNSGIVRFNDTSQLRKGIPDANKSAYLDYSMKALENFSYNWAKLSFNSQKNDLLITMQLDGKPAEALPFGYQNGQIVPSNQGPGLQHPIRLDVNFRFPMIELFQYGKNIQSMMENM